MRFTTGAVLAALSTIAATQTLANLPQCAQTCFGNSFGSCGTLNIACICGNTTLISQLSCCVFKGCSKDDQNTTISLAHNLCKANGVEVPTSASCASTASATSATSSSATASAAGSTGIAAPFPTAAAGASILGMAMFGMLAL